MDERVETIVIGAGQAGLAMSWHLSQRGCEHLVLERARIAERWRTQRWDSLHFQFPNWTIELPGHPPYAGGSPDAFAHRSEVWGFLEEYAAAVRAPVRCGVEVTALRGDEKNGYTQADDLLDAHIALVKRRIQSLRALEKQLGALRKTCDGDTSHACAILESFMTAAQDHACACHTVAN